MKINEINTQQLILEVTRRCNMACEHCMRGDAQDMDMDIGLIDKALSSVSDIGCMTFSGGEPTLNVRQSGIPFSIVKNTRSL